MFRPHDQRVRWLVRLTAAAGGIAVVTSIAVRLGANVPTAGFAFFLTILGVAVWTDLSTALISSVLATLCYNYFFLPPLRTFTIQEPDNWVALLSFLIASVVASRLVLRARIEAERAEQLYAERERFLEDRARIQALKESDAMKTALLRAVSHDLATPLTAIGLQVERLQSIVSDPALESITEQVARLRRRIENLLAMARLEARGVVPRPEPTPAADLFRAAREHLPVIVQSRPVYAHVTDDCPDVLVDPSLALEILVNLIENAHEASPPGAAIELSASPLDAERVRLEVADRGRGLTGAPADPERRGLGLEIARNFGSASNGAVTLINRPGGGAVACVDLPAAHFPVAEEAAV